MKPPSLLRRPVAAWILLTLFLGLVGYVYGMRVRTDAGGLRSAAQGHYATTIYTEAAAIQRSLERFPRNHNAHGAVARLVSVSTYSDTLTTVPRDRDSNSPIWSVAVLGDGLTVEQVLHLPFDTDSPDIRPAVGAEYVWDANAGSLMAEYGLLDIAEYRAIANLKNEPLRIEAATFPPPIQE